VRNPELYEDGDYTTTGVAALDYEDWIDLTPACPIDGGEGVLLGTLGRRTYHRCRSCGYVFSDPSR
jgi:hypothetical protein